MHMYTTYNYIDSLYIESRVEFRMLLLKIKNTPYVTVSLFLVLNSPRSVEGVGQAFDQLEVQLNTGSERPSYLVGSIPEPQIRDC